MKKYYVIRLAFDDGFWNEEKQDFVGWLNSSKYDEQFAVGTDCIVSYDCPFQRELLKASSKKPVTVISVYENE